MGNSDLDLRSRDIIYVCYKKDEKGREIPSILYNVTTNRYVDLSKQGCFIVTAVYGTSDTEYLPLFYHFRDFLLMSSYFGRKTVDMYYRISPTFAGFLVKHELVRNIVRHFLIELIASILKLVKN